MASMSTTTSPPVGPFPPRDTRLAIRSAAEYYTQAHPQPASHPGSPDESKRTLPTAPVPSGQASLGPEIQKIIAPRDNEGNGQVANTTAAAEDPNLPCSRGAETHKRHVESANRSVVHLNDVQDDELLQILLKNDTIAARFQEACASRLDQYQQSLERAYNQRLADMEKYTRDWRDTTKELWLAVKEGKCPTVTQEQQEFLAWPGPQQMANALGPLPTGTLTRSSSETMVDKSSEELRESSPVIAGPSGPNTFNPVVDGRVELPVSALPDHEASQLSEAPKLLSAKVDQHPLQPWLPFVPFSEPPSLDAQWVGDTEGYREDKAKGGLTWRSMRLAATVCVRDAGPGMRRFLKIPKARRMVIEYKDPGGNLSYRDVNAVHSVLGGLINTDVIIDLTCANVALFGRALCYLKGRQDRVWSLSKLPGTPLVDNETLELCTFFFSRRAATKLRINRFMPDHPRLSGIFSAEEHSKPEEWGLVIGRPRHQDGHIEGVDFFDVGLERRTPRLNTKLAIVLSEDACSLHRIASVLKFATKYVVPDFRSTMATADHMRPSWTGPETGQAGQQTTFQHAGNPGTQKAQATLVKPTKPMTLFERVTELSSEFHVLNAGTRRESLGAELEQQPLHFGEVAHPTSRSSSYSDTHQTQSPQADEGTGGATFFADDAFDHFCKSLMGTELDNDSNDVIALGGPPPDWSFETTLVDSEAESDDLVVLDGPPRDVCFDRRKRTRQDERVASPSAEPPVKRVRLAISCENSATDDQQSTGAAQDGENSTNETDRMPIATLVESDQHPSTLPIDGENVAVVGSQAPQAQSNALTSPLSVQPSNAPTNPQQG